MKYFEAAGVVWYLIVLTTAPVGIGLEFLILLCRAYQLTQSAWILIIYWAVGLLQWIFVFKFWRKNRNRKKAKKRDFLNLARAEVRLHKK